MSSSRSSLRRGAVAAAVLALSTLSLAGCGAGFDAETSQIRPDNVQEQVGNIAVQNVTVITTEDGEGPASVTARVFNSGDQDETLNAITFASDGSTGTFELSPADGGSLTVPAGGHLMLGGEGNASAVVENAGRKQITDGEAQQLTFELSATGDIDVRALVFPEDVITYDRWGPSTSPSPAEEAPAGEESPVGEETPEGQSPEGEDAPEGEQAAEEESAETDEAPGDEAPPADGVESAR